jgi:TolB-like protein
MPTATACIRLTRPDKLTVPFEGFRLDRRSGVLFRRDQQGVFAPIAIGRRALDLLGVLVERPGDLVSRNEIIEAVWPVTTVEDSNLNVQIAALRRILDDGRAEGSCIQTVSGRGYRFVGPVTRVEPAVPPAGNGQPHAPNIGVSAHLAAAPRLSIVVLPFSNLSDDREQQYFADGITEDLTTDLSRLADMLVISRNTAITYRSKPVGTKQIGRELCVRYVLEGSVRRSGDQVRVNAQLIDAETNAHLWAERFDRDMGDLFALQNEITGRIAVELNLELIASEAARPTAKPDAFDYMLRGRAAGLKPKTRKNHAEAISLYERALALDPRSVAAQSYLAGELAGRVLNQMTDSPTADISRAEELAECALAESLAASDRIWRKVKCCARRAGFRKRSPSTKRSSSSTAITRMQYPPSATVSSLQDPWTKRSRCSNDSSASARAIPLSVRPISESGLRILYNRELTMRLFGSRRRAAPSPNFRMLVRFWLPPMRSEARPNALQLNSPQPAS